MNAKDYLRQSYRIKELIESEKESLQTLRDLSESISSDMSSERVQCSKSNDATANIVAKIVDQEEIINRRIEELVNVKMQLIDMIDKLEDVNERTLLNLRYVSNNSWKEIASKMKYSMRSVHYIHASALNNFEALLKNVA